jgi:hypothetical protein
VEIYPNCFQFCQLLGAVLSDSCAIYFRGIVLE